MSNNLKGYIHSTESFGTVDGPGIRFVVFFSGCPMRCKYCHNPDTWEMKGGSLLSVEDIMERYDGVKTLIRNGGITATGGEPLMQIDFLTELFETARSRGINTCLDTSGIAFNRNNPSLMLKYDRLMKSTDLVMLDIKHIDNEEHIKLCAQSNENILDFLKYLNEKNITVWIRHVVVPTITLDEKWLYQLGLHIGKYRNIKALDVLPYHDMGKAKYEKLGLEYPLPDIEPATKDQAIFARDIILKGMKETRSRMK